MTALFRPRSLYCPACGAEITPDEMVKMPTLYCTNCSVALQMNLKGNWVYALATAAVAWIIAYLRGLHSIIFAFWFLVYWGVETVLVFYLAWPLSFPKKLVIDEPQIQSLGLKTPKK